MQTYEKEGISWKKLEFNDNQPTLDLINKRPVGIFHLLDDESNFPKFVLKCLLNNEQETFSLYD
jgi:myosin heavy subunit